MEAAEQTAHKAANGDNHRHLQNQREEVRHQGPSLDAGTACKTAEKSTPVHDEQSLTNNFPVMDRGLALPSTVAFNDNVRAPQPASLDQGTEGGTNDRTAVPSRVPLAVALGPFLKANTKFLPDCEMTSAFSGEVVSALPQGREST